VDQERFLEAQKAYDAGDYRTAAKAFLAAASRGPAGNGRAYHMAGNSLMRLRRHQDAVTVYGHALRDDAYDKRGAVHANLGAAYAALGEYAKAAAAYQAAVAEPGYATAYKAYQGMATALMERHKVEDAAVAYRKAALDPENPDPGKALVNLGLCFMALGRPTDAAEAYKAALGFDAYKGRGKALANLGIAYTQMGEYEEAVRAFDKATQAHGYEMSAAARQAFESAKSMSGGGKQTVDGWQTGDAVAVAVTQAAADGWATSELQALAADTGVEDEGSLVAEDAQVRAEAPDEAPETLDEVGVAGATAEADAAHSSERAADALGFGDDAAVTSFFEITESEMKQRDRDRRRAQRVSAGPAGRARTLVVWLVGSLAVFGCLMAAYYLGFGWPTQGNTTARLLEAYKAGKAVEGYWVAVPGKDVAREMAKIPPMSAYAVNTVKRGATTSSVSVTITPRKGAALRYTVTLEREGVGWKVSGIENSWRSTGE
jgi:tetratricopeptide (TPR) repeat protein